MRERERETNYGWPGLNEEERIMLARRTNNVILSDSREQIEAFLDEHREKIYFPNLVKEVKTLVVLRRIVKEDRGEPYRLH